jgi:hypothetical protein
MKHMLHSKSNRTAMTRAAMVLALVLLAVATIPVTMMRAEPPEALANPVTTDDVNSNTIATDVDYLLNPPFKADLQPVIQRIVSYGDGAVPILTRRLENKSELKPFHADPLIICLCRIGTDASLKPIQEILKNPSQSLDLSTVQGQELVAAIREYPTNREAEVLPQLIRLTDPPYSGMVSYTATERLREMIRRQPTVAGVIVASLDDDPKREKYSWNLGDILALESGHYARWGVFAPGPYTNLVALRNSIWRDWWERNKNKSIAEWKAEASVISATIPMEETPPTDSSNDIQK